MRLHTRLPESAIRGALALAQRDGEIDPVVYFTQLTRHNSRTHAHAYEIQLGSDVRHSAWAQAKNGNRRRTQANDAYAATWDEWGWLMLRVFMVDPSANWGGLYKSVAEFHQKTRQVFRNAESPTGRNDEYRGRWMEAVHEISNRTSCPVSVPSAPEGNYDEFGEDDPVFGVRLVGRRR